MGRMKELRGGRDPGSGEVAALRKRTGLFIKRFGSSEAGFGLNRGLWPEMIRV